MRKEPMIPPPAAITPRKLEIIEQKRKYELITPLYGGGVVATQPDPVTVVRATEIRGQLRFWWRAMRGGHVEGEPSLKEREDAIWGKAYEKKDIGIPQEQTIQIIVDIDPARQGKAVKPFEVQGRRSKAINGIPGYAAFPLQPDQKELKKPRPVIADLWEGISFTLTIVYPEKWSDEVKAALWAWETFGGMGARTRRGFGALHLLEIDGDPPQDLPTSGEVERWIRTEARKHSNAGSFPSDLHLPHISSEIQIVVIPFIGNPMRVWAMLIKKLQDFRLQKDEHNRSAWPEADAIRKIARKSPKNIPPSPQKFPRAAFGLPIIFHFTGDDPPEDHTVNEVDIGSEKHTENHTAHETDTESKKREHKERFASPLILRPFLCRDKQAVGLALLLKGSRVDLDNLVIQNESKQVVKVSGTPILKGKLTESEARAIAQKSSNSREGKDSLWALNNETDVLQAFMNFLKRG